MKRVTGLLALLVAVHGTTCHSCSSHQIASYLPPIWRMPAILLATLIACWGSSQASLLPSVTTRMFPIIKTNDIEHELTTNTSTEFRWILINKGCLNFRVKSHYSADIVLATDSLDKAAMYEISIGTKCNNRTEINKLENGSIVKKNRTTTSRILGGWKFRHLWVCWAPGEVSFGTSSAVTAPVITLKDPQFLGRINYYAVRNRGPYNAHWIIEDREEHRPRRVAAYKDFRRIKSGAVYFQVKGNYRAQIAVATTPMNNSTFYSVDVGFRDGVVSSICCNKVEKEFKPPATLGRKEFQEFAMQWHYGQATLWHKGQILVECDGLDESYGASYYGVRSRGIGVNEWRVSPIADRAKRYQGTLSCSTRPKPGLRRKEATAETGKNTTSFLENQIRK